MRHAVRENSVSLTGDGRSVLREDGQWQQRMSRAEAAKRIGASQKTIRTLESSALEKLRRSPKARSLLLEIREAGPEACRALLNSSEAEGDGVERLINYQLAVGEWWELADWASSGGCPEESGAIRAEIARFQGLLKEVIAKLKTEKL